MARVRLCVCGSWFVGREGQAAHPRAPGQCLHFECRGAPARVRVWRCEGRPPLPHHFVCVEKFTLPYLTLFLHTRPLRQGRGRRPPSPPSTDDMRILDAKRHNLGCVFHLRTPGVSTMIGFSKKIQLSLDGAPRLLSFVF